MRFLQVDDAPTAPSLLEQQLANVQAELANVKTQLAKAKQRRGHLPWAVLPCSNTVVAQQSQLAAATSMHRCLPTPQGLEFLSLLSLLCRRRSAVQAVGFGILHALLHLRSRVQLPTGTAEAVLYSLFAFDRTCDGIRSFLIGRQTGIYGTGGPHRRRLWRWACSEDSVATEPAFLS